MTMSFKLIFAVLAVAVASVSCRPFDGEESFDCSGMPDGYYSDSKHSKSFYSCSDGALLAKIVCEDGFVFNGIDACAPEFKESKTENELEAVENDDTNPPNDGDDDSTDDQEARPEMSKRKVINVEITKNVFPKSIVIIGKLNREQKNK